MNTKRNRPLVVAFVVAAVLFLFFGGWGMTGGMIQNGMNGNGWMGERSWMWTPTLFTLALGVALGWALFRKKDRSEHL
jgi:hypothetical protein